MTETTIVSIRLTTELKDKIQSTAESEHRSFSAQVSKDLTELYKEK